MRTFKPTHKLSWPFGGGFMDMVTMETTARMDVMIKHGDLIVVVRDANSNWPDCSVVLHEKYHEEFILNKRWLIPLPAVSTASIKKSSKLVEIDDMCKCGAFKALNAPKGSFLHQATGRGMLGCPWSTEYRRANK